MEPPPIRRRLRVRGIVQGVGFRPAVYTLATELDLAGFVGNDSRGVFIEIEGPGPALDRFQTALLGNPPPLAQIEGIEVEPLAPQGGQGFTIVASELPTQDAGPARTFVPPDVALCADCRRELLDPTDRRYHYPFINCTNCGPRFTIIRDLPYDRPQTTMSGFPMCDDCRREYENPLNRRFHAQPIACPVCGPRVSFRWSPAAAPPLFTSFTASPNASAAAGDAQALSLAALRAAHRALAGGMVVAIKGLGGYHLACDAANAAAVAQLRARKGRVDKPFAVMAASLQVAQRIALMDETEAALLTGIQRPIVLLRKRTGADPGGGLAAGVAPGNGYLGVMLPYTPLHELLFSDLAPGDRGTGERGEPPPCDVLVMTSGNLSEEPIAWQDEDALMRLAPLADAFLLHDRPIHASCDDSVVRSFAGQELPLRRARGYAPLPLALPTGVPPLLAVGADLKAVFCLAQGHHAVMSQHIGDMGNVETYDAFTYAVDHLQKLFEIAPEALVCDVHPGYLSTRWAQEHADGRPLLRVQHHHAHIAAVMAEHGAGTGSGDEPVIGFSFDGTGYGTDGAIWGGEVLLAGYGNCVRRGHLRYIPLPGGDAAVRRPYRTALAQLWAAGEAWTADLPPVRASTPEELTLLRRQLEGGVQAVPTSSIGRLCDAVAALAGVCQLAGYEAQAAIELEAQIETGLPAPPGGNSATYGGELLQSSYAFDYREDTTRSGDVTVMDAAPMIRRIAADVRAGRAAGAIAADFHAALVNLILLMSSKLRAETGIARVALSGGVFQNVTLLRSVVPLLWDRGFTVLLHRRVPPNDGGLALGQAMIGARLLLPK